MQYSDIIETSEDLLTRRLGHDIHLQLSEVVDEYPNAPGVVLRCLVSSSGPITLRSVIIKHPHETPNSLRREACGLHFVNSTERIRGLAPFCYGIDGAASVLVMEDLGSEKSQLLGSILFENDEHRGRQALIAFSKALAALHGNTIGQFDAYTKLCVGHPNEVLSRHRIHSIFKCLDNFGTLLASLNIPMPASAEHELQAVTNGLRNPGAFHVLTHGDATPANAFYSGNVLRLFDWEASDFRHAMLDGAFARIRYLHSVWARRLPLSVGREMEIAYRVELARHCSAAADDDVFTYAMAMGSAAWLTGICSFLPTVVETDKQWGESTIRQRIVAALEHYVEVDTVPQPFPALVELTSSLSERLCQLWPPNDCILPLYPAFSDCEN